MTTLTRNRDHKQFGDYTATYLTVSGTEGAVTLYGSELTTCVSWCTATERPGYDLADDCPVRGGRCWGDVYGTAVNRRVTEAWRSGGDDAAYAALEELYREVFGA